MFLLNHRELEKYRQKDCFPNRVFYDTLLSDITITNWDKFFCIGDLRPATCSFVTLSNQLEYNNDIIKCLIMQRNNRISNWKTDFKETNKELLILKLNFKDKCEKIKFILLNVTENVSFITVNDHILINIKDQRRFTSNKPFKNFFLPFLKQYKSKKIVFINEASTTNDEIHWDDYTVVLIVCNCKIHIEIKTWNSENVNDHVIYKIREYLINQQQQNNCEAINFAKRLIFIVQLSKEKLQDIVNETLLYDILEASLRSSINAHKNQCDFSFLR